MKTSTQLSTFDRIGVAVVALLGTCLGLGIAAANDIVLTPMLALLFPGSILEIAVFEFLGYGGYKVAVIASAWRTAQVMVCCFTDGIGLRTGFRGRVEIIWAQKNQELPSAKMNRD